MDPKYWYVGGVAYDFTPFVKNHPGGLYAIYLARGQECGVSRSSLTACLSPHCIISLCLRVAMFIVVNPFLSLKYASSIING
jgi:hypothetical protein